MTVTGKARAMLLMPLMMGVAIACSDQPLESPVVEAEALAPRLNVVEGDDQVGLAGEQLPDPLVVRLVDPQGRPLDEHPVTFHVTSGEGRVFAGSVLTDEEGRAQEWWTLGKSGGENILEARAADPVTGETLVQARFSAEGVAMTAEEVEDSARSDVSSRWRWWRRPTNVDWNSGVWSMKAGDMSVMLDLDRNTITVPGYGTFPTSSRMSGSNLVVTIDADRLGSGTMTLSESNGELRGTAEGAGIRANVVARRASTSAPAPETPSQPRPSEPAPSQPAPSQPAPTQPGTSPKPPTSGVGERRNEPAGFSMITERSFSSLNEAGWRDRGASASSGVRASIDIVNDPSAPGADKQVGRVVFPRGFTGSGSSSRMVNSGVNVGTPDKLYMSFWFKVSDNWYGHTGSSVNKVFYVGHPLVIDAHGNGNSPLHLQLSLQGGETSNAKWNSSDNEVRPTSAQAQIRRGEWHHIEVLVEMNTPGQANGRLHAWIDGVKTHQFSNRRILAAGGGGRGEIGELRWHPIYGGQNGSNIPSDQYQYIDHIYVSGSR